ncbi:hypothetical protein, partial [Nocardiopsis lucentensis]|uniref:hypothetical protein n=1 Tax=Nocardiopsis lucentensis TaxID=53441 RepID=UPI0019D3251E
RSRRPLPTTEKEKVTHGTQTPFPHREPHAPNTPKQATTTTLNSKNVKTKADQTATMKINESDYKTLSSHGLHSKNLP